MAAVAVVAVLVWLVYVIVGRRTAAVTDRIKTPGSRWYEYLLAAGLLIALIVVGVLLLRWGLSGDMPGGTDGDWRTGSKTMVFIVILATAAGLALLIFLLVLLRRLPERTAAAAGGGGGGVTGNPAAAAGYQTPSGMRLLGLLLFALTILLAGWLYLPPPQQYQLMLQLVYPATVAVALVLLFDKATRSWTPKSHWASLREWLYCDAMVFLLVLGFINLMRAGSAGSYPTLFWDMLYIALFFFVFWLLDRKLTRYRFLVAQGYLILLPLLLLLWQTMQLTAPVEGAAEAGGPISWWGTIWPFLVLAVIVFVLEIIALVAARQPEEHPLPAIKDIIFFVLYAILLISAIPPAAEVAK
jgi:hypothetical protein